MKLLLDTHIIIWSVSTPDRLSEKTKRYIMNAEALYISAASIWEISIKIQLGKLELDLPAFIREIHEPLTLLTNDLELSQYSALVRHTDSL